MSSPSQEHRFIARAEMRLARRDDPLREVPLRPDPLERFARVFELVQPQLGESASVCVDLLPVTARRRARHRQEILRRADRDEPSSRRGTDQVADFLQTMLGRAGVDIGGRSVAELVARSQSNRELKDKIQTDAMFELQILLRVESKYQGRAKELLNEFVSAFEQFSGPNSFRRVGYGIVGADVPGRRQWHDLRMDTGLFAPGRRQIVSSWEIAGLLKPPTRHCRGKILRTGPTIPPAPRELPRYKRQADVLPLGRVYTPEGPKVVGMRERDFFFGYIAGRSRMGKTELALAQLLHIAHRTTRGALFFDPHRDAILRMSEYLTTPKVRERVMVIDLTDARQSARVVTWNPLAMAGRPEEQIAQRTQALIDGISVAAGWAKTSTRSLAILSNAARTLLWLSSRLPAEASPTLWTILPLLEDEDFRAAVCSVLPPPMARYWLTTFDSMPADAINPLTQLLSRLEMNPAVRATFGAPIGTYDLRQAMDDGRIVLICPGGGGEALVSNLFMQDFVAAARSRADMDPARRRLFYAWFDELQAYDGATSSGGISSMAQLLEQCAKYGVRVTGMSQSPEALQDATRGAIATNASALAVTSNGKDGARLFAGEWGPWINDTVGAVQQLERHHYLIQPTHQGQRVNPFLLAGMSLEEFWPDMRDSSPEAMQALEEIQNTRYRPQTIAQVLRDIDEHPNRILRSLGQLAPAPTGPQLRAVDELAPEMSKPSSTPAPGPLAGEFAGELSVPVRRLNLS